jgi:(1->4)-alpha-D-glucan 1-alpha-D-glucosylmutase
MTDEDSSVRPVPRATYRLQLHKGFTFAHAAALAPYLSRLGISHAYLSPVLKARRGSMHGYDTVDHTILNPELGTMLEFEAMAAAYKAEGMGIILDIVPNHMGIGGDQNAKWLDVLEWGPRSRYADWFDINWDPSEPTLKNKVLVPFLGQSFGDALEQGKLEVRRDDKTGDFSVWAEQTHKLPICPDTYHLIGSMEGVGHLNGADGREDLARLIDAQYWRLARFSVATDDINYRRFFIVSDLAAIRVERDDVFEEVHRLVFDLVGRGLVGGLRVDHVDGLYDPKAYLHKLRAMCPRPIYLVVEKILAPHESLRVGWDVEGTTGYEFASVVTRLLTDPAGETKLTKAYETFTGQTSRLQDIERDAKRAIMDFEMAAELDALSNRLRTLAATDAKTADLTRNAIRSGLREVIACLPVYRTYLDGGGLDDEDRRVVAVAVAEAREAVPAIDPAVFDFLNDIMVGELCKKHPGYDQKAAVDVARRIQQYSGPVMAKGLEDTALYRYNRLIALSDVGEKPDRFSTSVAAFHDANRQRLRDHPHGMLASSSHDTKRGEDVRARLAALSGYVDGWTGLVEKLSEQLREAGAPDIDANDRYYFFQTLFGAWPTNITAKSAATELDAFHRRLDAAMLKSVREARLRTNWSVPRSDYEEEVSSFIATAFQNGEVLKSLEQFERLIGTAGAQNGLIEVVLKLTVPGVPDIYQGAEFWEQSMVDPDNRRSVDFSLRELSIATEPVWAELFATWRDGRIKQHVIARLLGLRRRLPAVFDYGSYEPIGMGDHICAFERRHGTDRVLVAVRLSPWSPESWDGPSLDAWSMVDFVDLMGGEVSGRPAPGWPFKVLYQTTK